MQNTKRFYVIAMETRHWCRPRDAYRIKTGRADAEFTPVKQVSK